MPEVVIDIAVGATTLRLTVSPAAIAVAKPVPLPGRAIAAAVPAASIITAPAAPPRPSPRPAIARQLGRGADGALHKAQCLGPRKAAATVVTAELAPKRNLACVIPDPNPAPARILSPAAVATPVSLFDHKIGQCRWIVGDGWPVMYCGAPVVDSPSWCAGHARLVFAYDGERRRRRSTRSSRLWDWFNGWSPTSPPISPARSGRCGASRAPRKIAGILTAFGRSDMLARTVAAQVAEELVRYIQQLAVHS